MIPASTCLIFITGGVLSSLGKGLATASIACLLERTGLRIGLLKCDPYLNVDPGTMNPFQHGEVFVTEDGAETDLDLGHYERFTSRTMGRVNNITAGQIYHSVLTRERRGEYLGGTVQLIPHVTDAINAAIATAAADQDVLLIEIGGTVGDIESLPFLEAIRQFKHDLGPTRVLVVHLTLVPYIAAAGELKSKPTQHSVRQLLQLGIQPDFLLCRADRPLPPSLTQKIALFCNVDQHAVLTAQDVTNIYEIPLRLHAQGLTTLLTTRLELPAGPPDLRSWERMVSRFRTAQDTVRIAVVGKYLNTKDAYKSLTEALTHGGLPHSCRVDIVGIDAETIEHQGAIAHLDRVSGILVPGGFGARGIAGKIAAIRFAREQRVPFLGICLGMQCAVIEFARNVCDLEGATSREFDPHASQPVIDLLPTQRDVETLGGTMRLGAYPCDLAPNSTARLAYGVDRIVERHRHRYELNPTYRPLLEKHGLRISGLSPSGALAELIELPTHPWFVAGQFHPEFRSRPLAPHPLFSAFIKAALDHQGVTTTGLGQPITLHIDRKAD